MRCLVVSVLLFCLVSCKKSADPAPTNTGPYFAKVKVIIATNCLTCHSSTGSWAGRPTAFDTDDEIVAVAHAIKAAVADPVTITNHRMPQGGSLSQTDINTIVAWYNAGGLAMD